MKGRLDVVVAALDAYFGVSEDVLRDILGGINGDDVHKARSGYYMAGGPVS